MIGLEAQRLRIEFENVIELCRGALREESRCVFHGSHCDNAGFDRRPSGRSTSAAYCRCSVKRVRRCCCRRRRWLLPTAAAAAATGGVAVFRPLFAEESYFTLANSLTSAARVSASRGKSMTVGERVSRATLQALATLRALATLVNRKIRERTCV